MSTSRPILFWIATFAATMAVVVLLHQVLLPFVAGMVLAYLLDPLANRVERLGVNRLVATLAIIAFAVALITAMFILTVPVIIRELSHFVEQFPLYVRRVHTLATDPDRPWLSKIVGEGLGETERSISELTKFARLGRQHHPIGLVGGTSSDFDPFDWHRHADRCLLPPLRLEQNGCDHR